MEPPARLPVPITIMLVAEIVRSAGITEAKLTENTGLSS